MSRRIASVLCLGVAVCASNGACAAESYLDKTFFNKYILLAVQKMQKYSDVKYSLSANFSKRLNYGDTSIPARNEGATMCNGAVTQAIIEAIEIYRSEPGNRDWKPEAFIPAEAWYKSDWTMLKPHLFSESYFEYPPLEFVPRESLWGGLQKDITKFQSERGMGIALEKFGLGQTVEFEEARPGDLVSFDRTMRICEQVTEGSLTGCKSAGGHGHSVIFLNYLTKDQKETPKYSSNVKGFTYFSVQSSEPEGLGKRWGYFKGFCPNSPGKKAPESGKPFCPDPLSRDKNRAPPLAYNHHVTDCCIVDPDDKDRPRLGRVLMPSKYWNRFAARQTQIKADLAKIKVAEQKNVEELLKKHEILKLYGKGAIAIVEAGESTGANANARKAAKAARKYIDDVYEATKIDLREIARAGQAREANYRQWIRIAKMTPAAIVKKANQQVRTADKAQIDRIAKTEAKKNMERVASQEGAPNAKFDGRSY